MTWMIFKTDIVGEKQTSVLAQVLQQHPDIVKWTIDQEDIDNVLRVEGKNSIEEKHVIQLLQNSGFEIEPLLD